MIKKSILASAKNMSFAKTTDGKTLQNIGNGILRGGAPVFTDGKCIYGRMKRNEAPAPIVVDEVEDGVPLLTSSGQIGYYSPKKKKVIPSQSGKIKSSNMVFLTNDKKNFSFHRWDYFSTPLRNEWLFSDVGALMDFEVDEKGNMLYANVGYFDVNNAKPYNGEEGTVVYNEFMANLYEHFLAKSYKPPGEVHNRNNIVHTCTDFPCCIERDGSVSMWMLFHFDKYSYERIGWESVTHNVIERFLGRARFSNLKNPGSWSFEEYGHMIFYAPWASYDSLVRAGQYDSLVRVGQHEATKETITLDVPVQDGIYWKGTVTIDMDSTDLGYMMLPNKCGEYGTLYDEASNIILENVPFDERHAIEGDGHNPPVRKSWPCRGMCRLSGKKTPVKEDDGYSKDEYLYLSGNHLYICKNQTVREVENGYNGWTNQRLRLLSKEKMRTFLKMNIDVK